MRCAPRSTLQAAAFAAAFFVGNGAVRAAPAGDLVLTGANVVDPATRTVAVRDLFVHDGQLVATRAETHDARRLDVAGKWILPGLVDAHTHSEGNANPTWVPDDDLGPVGTAKAMLMAGVTAFVDLAGSEGKLLPLRDAWRDGPSPGAEMLAAGPAFAKGFKGLQKPGDGMRAIMSPDDAKVQLEQLAVKKPDVIKILQDHNNGLAMPLDSLAALVTAAKAHGFPIITHIGTWDDARDAMLAGVDVITHLNDDAIVPEDVARLMADRHVISMPTLAVQCDMINLQADKTILEDPLLVAVTSASLREAYRARAKFNPKARSALVWQKQCFTNDRISMTRLLRAGVTMMAGSDASNVGVFQGFSLHRELELLVDAGATPWDALAAATIVPARLFKRAWGVSPGDAANLLVLDASPLAAITNTKRIHAVVFRGRVVDRTALEPR